MLKWMIEPLRRFSVELRRRGGNASLAAVIIAPVALFSTALLRGRLIARFDGYTAYIPRFVMAARSWKSGAIPTWNAYAYSGYPLLGVQQAGVFYPPNAAFLVLSPASAAAVASLTSYVIAGIGAWMLAKELCGDRVAATVAGIAYGLSGFLVAHADHHSMVASAAWLPWALWAFDRVRQRPSGARFTLAAVTVALPFIAGFTHIAMYVVLALCLYGVVVWVAGLRRGRDHTPLWLSAVIAVGFALAAIQLVPGLAILAETDRARYTYEQAMSFSVPRSHALLLLFPYLFGQSEEISPYGGPYSGQWNIAEMTGYPGAAALVLAAAGIIALRRDRRAMAMAAVGLAGLLIAFPTATPFGRAFHQMPIYGQFRAWARAFMLFDLAVAIFAAYGVAWLRDPETPYRRSTVQRAWMAATSVAAIGTLLFIAPVDGVRRFMPGGEPRVASAAIPAAFALVAAVSLSLLRSSRKWAALIVAVVALDAAISFGAFFEWQRSATVADLNEHLTPHVVYRWGRVHDAPGGIDRYLSVGLYDQLLGTDRTDLTYLSGSRSANGGDPLAPRAYIEMVGMDQSGNITDGRHLWANGSDILDVLRVSTVVVGPPAVQPSGRSLLHDGQRVSTGTDVRRYTYEPVIPEAVIVGSTEHASRPRIRRALLGAVPFEPSSTALVEDACPGCAHGPPGAAGRTRRVVRRADTITVDLDVRRPGLLVVSEAWFPGWTATVDGRRTDVLRANGLVLGVPVRPGDDVVQLRYEAPGLRLGAVMTSASALGLVAWMVGERIRRRACDRRP